MPPTAETLKVVKDDPYKWQAAGRYRKNSDWARWELVGLQPTLDLNSLVLRWVDRKVRDVQIKGAITGITLERTIEGASTITLTLGDVPDWLFSTKEKREYRNPVPTPKGSPVERDEAWMPLATPDMVGKEMWINVDGAHFRMVGASYHWQSREMTLTFEDEIVYLLRRKRGERRAARDKVTRAQFVLSLVREVKSARPPFVCPELMVRQPIGASEKTVDSKTTTSLGGGTGKVKDDPGGGFPPGARLTVKGAPASAAQRKRMDGILAEAASLGASEDVMAACLACATQESVMGASAGMTGNDDMGIMQQGRNWIPAGDTMNPAAVTNAFLLSGTPQAKGHGAAPGYKRIHGNLTSLPGGFEAAIKRVQVSVGGYGPWEQESRMAVKAWGGSSGGGASAGTPGSMTTSTTYVTRSYQYAREKDENSWDAIKRLGDEVGWRAFVVGHAFYFMSEPQLYKRRPRYTITPGHPAIIDLTYDVDWGKPVSEATLTVSLDHWGASPGSIMLLQDFGPADGRWLVTSVRRDWFTPIAEVTLKQPGKQLLEPAAEKEARTQTALTAGGVAGGSFAPGTPELAQKVYEAAVEATAMNWYYSQPRRNDQRPNGNADCSSGVSWVLDRAGIHIPQPMKPNAPVSGQYLSWGDPGPGRFFTIMTNRGHIWIRWNGIGKYWRFDTRAFSGDTYTRRSGGRNRTAPAPDSAQFTQRHWPGL